MGTASLLLLLKKLGYHTTWTVVFNLLRSETSPKQGAQGFLFLERNLKPEGCYGVPVRIFDMPCRTGIALRATWDKNAWTG
jgi:hypothetical protein